MEEYWIGLKIGAIGTGAILLVFGVIGVVYLLAKKDILFTFVEEATAKAIMKFGAFHKIVMQYENCTCIGKNSWDIKLYDPTKEEKAPRGRFERLFGGLKWVGIPGVYSVYEYSFRWTTVKPSKKEGEQIEKREKDIRHIFVKDYVYFGEVGSAETKSLVPLDIGFLMTIRVMNPYKALFRVHDWMNAVTARIETYFRQFVSGTEFEDLIAKKQQMGGEIMKAMEKTGMLGDEGKFLKDYGVKVKNLEMLSIDPAGENKKVIQEAATKQWVAERQKRQILILADAEAQRLTKVYGKIKEFGPDGITLRTLEAIESAGAKAGNWILALPSQIQRLFEGGRKGE